MTEQNPPAKRRGRVSRTIEQEIEVLREKLRKAENKKREDDRKKRERNQKAILQLISSSNLDEVGAEQWERVLPKLKELLASETAA